MFVFQDRMISMTLDKDNEVAVQTMKLLLIISKWVTSLFVIIIIFKASFIFSFASNDFWLLRSSDDVLSPDDYKQLLQFVYSSQRPLAATAGELLFSRYVGLHHLEQTNKQKAKANKQ